MKFTAQKGKIVNFKGKLLFFKNGNYETESKEEQAILKKCKNVEVTVQKS